MYEQLNILPLDISRRRSSENQAHFSHTKHRNTHTHTRRVHYISLSSDLQLRKIQYMQCMYMCIDVVNETCMRARKLEY